MKKCKRCGGYRFGDEEELKKCEEELKKKTEEFDFYKNKNLVENQIKSSKKILYKLLDKMITPRNILKKEILT